MHLTRERVTLVQALSSMAVLARRDITRRFLEGLSTDELEYIAEYIGSQLLDPSAELPDCDRNELALQIERFQFSRYPGPMMRQRPESDGPVAVRNCTDTAHKMILLLEFLSMSEMGRRPVAWSGEGSA